MAWHPPMIKWKLTTLKYTKKSAISRTLLAKKLNIKNVFLS